MARRNSFAIRIHHTHHQCRVCRNLGHDRPIRLDHGVGDDFLHAVRCRHTECCVIYITQIILRLRYGFYDTQEARGSIGCKRLRRIRQCLYIDNSTAVEVVDTAYVQDRLTVVIQCVVHREQVRSIEYNGRNRSRVSRHDFSKHEAFFTRYNRLLCLIARIVYPDAVQGLRDGEHAIRYRYDIVRVYDEYIGQPVVGAGYDEWINFRRAQIGVNVCFNETTLTPAHEHAARTVLNRIRGKITTTRRRLSRLGHNIIDRRVFLRGAC